MTRENDLIKTVRQLTYSDKYMGKKVLPLMAKEAFLDVLAGIQPHKFCDTFSRGILANFNQLIPKARM